MKAPCGQEDCGCGHTIERLETERGQMRWLVAAVVRGARAGSGFRPEYREHHRCPHGNTPFYPAHGWWCDECWAALHNIIKYDQVLLIRGRLALTL